MQILVQKFGGTSLSTEGNRRHVIKQIKHALQKKYKLVVVVSALGRKPDPYATDTLLSLVQFPKHFTTKRDLDLLASCGETISSVVLSNELQKHRIATTALTGAQAGIITNDEFTQAKIKQIQTDNIIDVLKQKDVVIVAGFQGQSVSGETTTIGRGGSDTTAVALGVALQAERIEIFTDVHGIMTADPQLVKTAQALDVVTYLEICHLAYQGAKVVHPRAVELAMQVNIPIRVRSTYSKKKGTLVSNSKAEQKIISDRLVTGIAHMKDISQIQIRLNEGAQQLQSDVFKAMASAGISVDFINISPSGLIYTVPTATADTAVNILNSLHFYPTVKHHCAKVSAVGAGMSGVPGIASKIVEAITDKGIQILQSADSYTTIWVLIDEKHLIKAVNALHDVFQLHKKVEVN